jgi:hypothetical protein
MKLMEEKFMWWILISLVLFCVNCERRTMVKLEGGNPPTFVLYGSGNLVEFSIGRDLQDKTLNPSKRSPVIWKLTPTSRDGEKVENIGRIVYGVVPHGYRQAIPAEGQPPELIAGNYYYYYVETINAPHADGDFEIKDGKPVRVKGVGTCYKVVNGQEIESLCGETSDNRNSSPQR